MPSLKSSTRGGDTITLFASERTTLGKTIGILDWLASHSDAPGITKSCDTAVESIKHVLCEYPGQERFVKDKAASK